jgi:hypothetical protein
MNVFFKIQGGPWPTRSPTCLRPWPYHGSLKLSLQRVCLAHISCILFRRTIISANVGLTEGVGSQLSCINLQPNEPREQRNRWMPNTAFLHMQKHPRQLAGSLLSSVASSMCLGRATFSSNIPTEMSLPECKQSSEKSVIQYKL